VQSDLPRGGRKRNAEYECNEEEMGMGKREMEAKDMKRGERRGG
jgi:hypothetical protein